MKYSSAKSCVNYLVYRVSRAFDLYVIKDNSRVDQQYPIDWTALLIRDQTTGYLVSTTGYLVLYYTRLYLIFTGDLPEKGNINVATFADATSVIATGRDNLKSTSIGVKHGKSN